MIRGTFIIIPGGVANSYRKRYGTYSELDPIKLEGKNEYILPLEVLDNPAFDEVKPDLGTFTQREVTDTELPFGNLEE